MWKPIINCDRQLTLNSRVRERVDSSFLVYEIISVEFDQYKLELINRDNMPVAEKIHNVLSCSQITEYHFEVEEKELVK
jgi:hypothetical protein